MSHRTAAAALVALLVLAGCGGLPGETDTTTDATTDSDEGGDRVIAAPPSGNETTGTTTEATESVTSETTATTATTRETTRVTYNRDVGYTVQLSNANGTAKNVTVTIASENDSTVAFEESVRLPPNESREFDFSFPHAGTYEVTAEVGEETVTRDWDVGVRDPDHGLSVFVAGDGEVRVGLEAI